MTPGLEDFLDPLTHKLIHKTSIVTIPASQVTAGTFGAGNFVFPGVLTLPLIELRNTTGNAAIDFTRSPGTIDYDVRVENSAAGVLNFASPTAPLKLSGIQTLDFVDEVRDAKVDLYGGTYLIGVRDNELFFKSGGTKFGWETPPGSWGMRYGANETDGGAQTGLKVTGQIEATAWLRSGGNSGWYNQTYGGGIMMQDSTYVRVHGSKAFYNALEIRSDSKFVAAYTQGSTGVYFRTDVDGNHRIYGNAGLDGVTIVGWVSSQLTCAAQDVMVEPGRGAGTVRHVNNASSAWRPSDASVHNNMSDPKMKRNIRSLGVNQLEKVKQIKPIIFKWKNGEDADVENPNKDHFGFDATELPPEATKKAYLYGGESLEDPIETLMMNPVAVLALLWQGVLELTDKVEILEKKK
jgi:hypothetical protein